MPFHWKEHKDVWKGEGIYFLTFNVKNRTRLLGRLRGLDYPDKDGHIATVDAYDLGMEVYREFGKLQARYDGFQVIGKQIMPNHFHVVVWCHEEFGDQSIKMVARGFAQACSRIAREMLAQGRLTGAVDPEACSAGGNYGRYDRPDTNNKTAGGGAGAGGAGAGAGSAGAGAGGGAGAGSAAGGGGGAAAGGAAGGGISPVALLSVEAQSYCAESHPFYCGNGTNTLFETPYIRTLCHRGQLDRMVHYTHANPDNAWARHLSPELYVIRRNIQLAGLHFDGMGKTRLLDYPDRHVVALSRSLSREQIATEVRKALLLAERGAVTYTAAINEGEKAVSKAIREGGYPLVVMMLDGFPQEGTEAARFFHPGGAYHKVCGEGRLMLLAPLPENYDTPRLIELTEQELARKAAEKGLRYAGIPHDSKRWRMIAGNMMLWMITEG